MAVEEEAVPPAPRDAGAASRGAPAAMAGDGATAAATGPLTGVSAALAASNCLARSCCHAATMERALAPPCPSYTQ